MCSFLFPDTVFCMLDWHRIYTQIFRPSFYHLWQIAVNLRYVSSLYTHGWQCDEVSQAG